MAIYCAGIPNNWPLSVMSNFFCFRIVTGVSVFIFHNVSTLPLLLSSTFLQVNVVIASVKLCAELERFSTEGKTNLGLSSLNAVSLNDAGSSSGKPQTNIESSCVSICLTS